jgi:hypothetical protein
MLHSTLDSNDTGARLAQNTVVSKDTDMFLQGERDRVQLVSGQDVPFENDWIRENQYRIPKGPKADMWRSLRQDTPIDKPIENDWIKENLHLIPKGPKAHTSAESRQAEHTRELYVDVAKRGNMLRFSTGKDTHSNKKDARRTLNATKHVHSSLPNFAEVNTIHPSIEKLSYGRDEGYKSRNEEAVVHGDGDVMTLQTKTRSLDTSSFTLTRPRTRQRRHDPPNY